MCVKGMFVVDFGLFDVLILDDVILVVMVVYLILVNWLIVVMLKGMKFCCLLEVVLDLLDCKFDYFMKEDGEVVYF